MDDKLMAGFFDEAKKAGQKNYSSSVNFFGIEEGKNKYRIVPFNGMLYHKTTKHFTKHFGVIDKETKKGISVVCSMDKFKTCPLCEEYSREVELDTGDAFKKAPRNFYNFYAIDHEAKPGVLEMDETCFNLLGKYVEKCMTDEDYGKRNILSLDAGSFIIIDVTVEKQKNGKNKRVFNFSKIERPQPLTKEDTDKLFADYPKLDVFRKEYPPEKLKAMLGTGRFDVLEDEKKDEGTKETVDNKKNNNNNEEVEEKSEKSIIEKLKADLEAGDDDVA